VVDDTYVMHGQEVQEEEEEVQLLMVEQTR
jgi:hypothetical protein